MLGFGVFLALAVGVQPTASARLEGADGFERAMQQHERTGKPLLLFVYTDWCPYCRVFMKETLKTQIVRRYMREILEVWLNPEDGIREEALAAKYGVRGYPTLFMFPWDSEEPRQINRSADPSTFVEICQAAAGLPPGGATSKSARGHRSSPRDTGVRAGNAPPVGPTVTVYLKNGEVVKGQLAGETTEMVLIETGNGQISYFRDMIDRVVTHSPSATQLGNR